jgi:hypothetical protein
MMNMYRSWYSFGAFLSLAALAITGCGSAVGASAPPKASVLVKEVGAAMRDAKSVHLSGTVQQGGKALGLNLSMTRSGEVSGQLSVGGAAFTVLSTQGSSYLKLSGAFLKFEHLPATACTLFCGKYLKVTAAQSQSLLNGLNMSDFTASMSKPSPHVRNAGSGTVNGQPVWLLRDADGSIAYVASQGKPYILRIVASHAAHGTLNLTQWNAVTIPGPPPAKQVVNLSELMH